MSKKIAFYAKIDTGSGNYEPKRHEGYATPAPNLVVHQKLSPDGVDPKGAWAVTETFSGAQVAYGFVSKKDADAVAACLHAGGVAKKLLPARFAKLRKAERLALRDAIDTQVASFGYERAGRFGREFRPVGE